MTEFMSFVCTNAAVLACRCWHFLDAYVFPIGIKRTIPFVLGSNSIKVMQILCCKKLSVTFREFKLNRFWMDANPTLGEGIDKRIFV